ncbi:MAG: DUF922 domain-containing Zn-dependent protease [Syntrophobacterales bacterium]
MKYCPRIILIICVISLASLVRAEPKVIIKYDYYDIRGNSANELRQQMNRFGIKWTNGKTYDAFTSWRVRWNYQYNASERGCAIRSVATTVHIVYRMPRWINYASAPYDLRDRWDIYIRALKVHEDGHRDFGIKAATEIERAIAVMTPRKTCEELGEEANGLGYRILEKYANEEKEYDARTNFGETQGAIFP